MAPLPSVRQRREARGLTQAALAGAIGLSRQGLSAIEAGRVDPATSLALKLALALGCSVEELFGSAGERVLDAEADPRLPVGAPVVLTRVGSRLIAHGLGADAGSASRATHGVALSRSRGSRDVRVSLWEHGDDGEATVVLLGCSPALGVLADRLNRQGSARFVWLHASSSAALDVFADGRAHVAGIHLHAGGSGDANVETVRRRVAGTDTDVFRLARSAAGLVVAAGNPKGISDVRDLARRDVRIAHREVGSGARQLLEVQLEAAGLQLDMLPRSDVTARGHFEVAHAVAVGAADVGLAWEGAARAYELDFIPLVDEPFDLVVRGARDARLTPLIDALQGASLRRELESRGSYAVTDCGQHIAALKAERRPRNPP